MARRATPAPADVAPALQPVKAAARRRERAEDGLRAAITKAAQHEPRPTNRQIGEAADLSEGAVRAILHGRRT